MEKHTASAAWRLHRWRLAELRGGRRAASERQRLLQLLLRVVARAAEHVRLTHAAAGSEQFVHVHVAPEAHEADERVARQLLERRLQRALRTVTQQAMHSNIEALQEARCASMRVRETESEENVH